MCSKIFKEEYFTFARLEKDNSLRGARPDRVKQKQI